MFKEFKQFAMKGNVLDLAVGMIIGAAFTSIVKGLVDHILGPILGLITGGVNLAYMKIIISGEGETAVTMNIGLFFQSVINFILVSFSVFLLVKAIRKMERKEEAKPAGPPEPTKSEILLEEIRDLLKK